MFQVYSLQHAGYLVADLDRAAAFYHGLLGLPLLERPELGYPGLWLQLGEAQQLHLMQLPNPDADRQAPEHGGRDRHIALHVNGLAELESRLQAAGIVYTFSRSGRRALFCHDPDGNALEFIEIDAG